MGIILSIELKILEGLRLPQISLMQDVSIPISFWAGLISFFSPCLLPMIPIFIMYITGVSMEDELQERRLRSLVRTLLFILGFTIIFMIMGTSASFLGKIFARNKNIFAKISGLLIMLFGLNTMGIFKINLLNTEKRLSGPRNITNSFGSLIMGMAFAAGWTPCFGPVLASILLYAGGAATVSKGVFLLFIYSMGMAIPFLLTAVFINAFIRFIEKADRFMKYMPIISGIFMVIFGILVFFNKVINISRILL